MARRVLGSSGSCRRLEELGLMKLGFVKATLGNKPGSRGGISWGCDSPMEGVLQTQQSIAVSQRRSQRMGDTLSPWCRVARSQATRFRDLAGGFWPQNLRVRFGEYDFTLRCWVLPSASRIPCCWVINISAVTAFCSWWLSLWRRSECQGKDFLKKRVQYFLYAWKKIKPKLVTHKPFPQDFALWPWAMRFCYEYS